MKRVVAIFGIEVDFYVAFGPIMVFENFSHLVAEVSLDFQNEAADTFFLVVARIAERFGRATR